MVSALQPKPVGLQYIDFSTLAASVVRDSDILETPAQESTGRAFGMKGLVVKRVDDIRAL
jgi:hypothetical protein